VVGSDQVWRPSFSTNIFNYFLDFAENQDVKRIAYAASFGTDNWEYTSEMGERCSQLIQHFDAVSVREKSAVQLCQQYLGVTPQLVLDPTMLLTAEDYLPLIASDNTLINDKSLMTYILNHKRKESYEVVNIVSELLSLKIIEGYPRWRLNEVPWWRINKCIVKPVEEWLHGIHDAEYVVTDSFHGTVFSLLFNKQFIVVDNPISGTARLKDMLEMVGLQDRLLASTKDVNKDLLQKRINYESINAILKEKRVESLNFLKKSFE
jgi:hypothetical protein